MTIADRLHNFPPIMVRLLSKRTTEEIAARVTTALPKYFSEADSVGVLKAITAAYNPAFAFVFAMSLEQHWDNITIAQAKDFMQACEVDILAPSIKRYTDYLSHTPTFQYLRKNKNAWPVNRELLLLWALNCKPTHPALVKLQRRLQKTHGLAAS
jgi:hypothetical protein